MTQRVFVSGLGVVSALGSGLTDFWSSLLAGDNGVSDVNRFDTSQLDRHRACEVRDFTAADFLSRAEVERTGRCSQFAMAAARMAVENAGLSQKAVSGARTSVILGTTMGDANILADLEATWIHKGDKALHDKVDSIPRYGTTLLPINVARAVGATGMVQTLPAACAAGNYAIGFATDQIRAGRADVVITGAAEIIEKLQFEGFVRLQAMSPDAVKPFDVDRRGILLGEGAGVLVLESEEHLIRRGGVPLAEVAGYGLACDAHHITRPDPDGSRSAFAMREALRSAGLTPTDVDFVNAHGTATASNDPVESRVIRDVFGAHRVPITSIKSMLGHCMGAASALEAVSCVLSMRDQRIPPTINHEALDPDCDVDVVANTARNAKCDVVLNNALAFGGYDAVVCFTQPELLQDTPGLAA